jgi:hypothetical protein
MMRFLLLVFLTTLTVLANYVGDWRLVSPVSSVWNIFVSGFVFFSIVKGRIWQKNHPRINNLFRRSLISAIYIGLLCLLIAAKDFVSVEERYIASYNYPQHHQTLHVYYQRLPCNDRVDAATCIDCMTSFDIWQQKSLLPIAYHLTNLMDAVNEGNNWYENGNKIRQHLLPQDGIIKIPHLRMGNSAKNEPKMVPTTWELNLAKSSV